MLQRYLYIALGFIALGLGFLGVFLPILPTTPFVLLAAFFFARASDRLHSWLLSSKTFGPFIYEWENYRVIPLRAKYLASVIMSLLMGYSTYAMELQLLSCVGLGLVYFSVLSFIWSCPSKRGESWQFWWLKLS